MRHEKRTWARVLPTVLKADNLLELCNVRIMHGEGGWDMRVNFVHGSLASAVIATDTKLSVS